MRTRADRISLSAILYAQDGQTKSKLRILFVGYDPSRPMPAAKGMYPGGMSKEAFVDDYPVRTVSAFASGLYYCFAGLLHVVKKPVSSNEQLALWSDLLIFIFLTFYFLRTI